MAAAQLESNVLAHLHPAQEKIGEGTYGKVYKAKDTTNNKLVALKKTRLEVSGQGSLGRGLQRTYWGKDMRSCLRYGQAKHADPFLHVQMEEEGVPSTTLREISLLQMLSESNHIVK